MNINFVLGCQSAAMAWVTKDMHVITDMNIRVHKIFFGSQKLGMLKIKKIRARFFNIVCLFGAGYATLVFVNIDRIHGRRMTDCSTIDRH